MPVQPRQQLDTMDLLRLGLQVKGMQQQAQQQALANQRAQEELAFRRGQEKRLNTVFQAQQQAAEQARIGRQSAAEGSLGLWSQHTGTPLASVPAQNMQRLLHELDPNQQVELLRSSYGKAQIPQFLGQATGEAGIGVIMQDPKTGVVSWQDVGAGKPPSQHKPTDPEKRAILHEAELKGISLTPAEKFWMQQYDLDQQKNRTRPYTATRVEGQRVFQEKGVETLQMNGTWKQTPTSTEKIKPFLSPAVVTAMQKQATAAQSESYKLMQAARKIVDNPELLSGPQSVANTMVGLMARWVDPNFKPADYKGSFQQLVNQAGLSEELKSELGRTFQIDYRIPVTGAQASFQEIERLLKDYPNNKEAAWKVLAKIGSIIASNRQRVAMYTDAMNNDRLPEIPPEVFDQFWQDVERFGRAPAPQGQGGGIESLDRAIDEALE